MSRFRAPMAFRTPISRVRSMTAASITFMMPTPPTSSETPVIAPIRILNTSSACVSCSTRVLLATMFTRSRHFIP